MSAISVTSESIELKLPPVRKSGDDEAPAMIVATSRTTVRVSQRPRRWRSSAGTAHAPPPQRVLDAQAQQAVGGDGAQQQRAVDRLVPERVDLQDRQGRGDGPQQQRAQDRAVHAARPAEDGHAADDDRGDDLQLEAGPGRRVDRAEARGVQDAGQAREGAAGHEGPEDPSADADARERRRLGVGADRVQLAARAVGAHRVAGDEHHDHRDQRQDRDAQDRVRADAQEAVGHVGGVDLPALGPLEVRAADDVQRPDRHHQRRHAAQRDQRAVDRAEAGADRDAQDDDERDRDARVVAEQGPDGQRGEAQDRADREVDVARDDDDRLPDGQHRDDRHVERDVAQVLAVEEAVVVERGADHEDRQHADQAQLAYAQQRVEHVAPLAAGARRRHRRRGGGVRDAHAATSACPVAARTTDSSVASSRESAAASRPSCMTSTRSAIPSTSGSSEEIISTARPSPASSDIKRCTSAFVPTSMPRVGSSMIRTFGPVASHFPSTTFCWLPPERKPTGSASLWYFSWSLAAQSEASFSSEPDPMIPRLLRSCCSRVRPMLRSIESSITRPCWRRSSGTRPMPAFMAADGEPRLSLSPSTKTSPASGVSTPKIARATSLRPAPTRPASATISPRRTSKETSMKTPSRVRPLTSRTFSPISASCLGKS